MQGWVDGLEWDGMGGQGIVGGRKRGRKGGEDGVFHVGRPAGDYKALNRVRSSLDL